MTAGPAVPDSGCALTRNQALVLEALAEAAVPLGAYDILDRVRGRGVRAPAQVYRALERLRDLGLVHRVETLNAFVPCRHAHENAQGPVILVICDHCGATRETEDRAIGGRLHALAATQGFLVQSSSLELRGTCSACAAQARTGRSAGDDAGS